jgi:hypothetical protein
LNNGKVGISTTSPATALEVGGYITTDSVLGCATLKTDTNGMINCISSDMRVKQDITPLASSSALSAIEQLKPVSFYWRDSTNGTARAGFIGTRRPTSVP